MLERRVIILLKYSLNPLNICVRGTFIRLKVICNLCAWIVVIKYIMKNSSKTFQTTPQMRLQRLSWNLLIRFSCICLGQATGQARSTICCCSVQIEKLQLKLYLWHVMFMTIPIILKVSLNFSRVFPSLNNSNNNNVFDLILWRPSIKIY